MFPHIPEAADLQVSLRLSAQIALLGAVTPPIRAVTLGMDDQTIVLRAYIDGEVTEELQEDISVVGTEIIADFTHLKINEEVIRLDFPNRIEDDLMWVYSRKECWDSLE